MSDRNEKDPTRICPPYPCRVEWVRWPTLSPTSLVQQCPTGTRKIRHGSTPVSCHVLSTRVWRPKVLSPCKKDCNSSNCVCVWCWHHIMDMAEKDETEGRCPACRTPYDKEKIVAMEANCQRVVSAKKEQKSKPQKPKLKKPESIVWNCEVLPCMVERNTDSFSKDEEAAVHTRNRVHQIVGATHNMQRLSGNMLPPPIDDPFNSSRVGTDKAAQRDITHSTVNSNGLLTCSHSSKDKDGRIKTPNRTFVDIVGGSSSGPEKDGSVAEERKILNLCSDFSSVTMDEGNHLETQYSNSMLCKVSSLGHLSIGLARDKDFQGYFQPFRESSKFSVLGGADFTSSDPCIVKGQSCLMSDSEKQVWPGSCSDVREDLLCFDDQRLKGSDSLSQESSVLASSYPIRISDCSNGHVKQRKDSRSLSDYDLEHSTVHNHVDEASISFTYVNSVPIDGYSERKFQCFTESDRNFRSRSEREFQSFTESDRNFRSCSERKFQSFAESDRNFRSCKLFSNEEMVEQLRRLDDDNITNDGDSSALNVVESSINIKYLFLLLSVTPVMVQGSAKCKPSIGGYEMQIWALLNVGMPCRHSTLGCPYHVFGSSLEFCIELPLMILLSRAQSSTPPGFSVPSREPSPGFSACERTNQVFSAASGSNLVKTSSLANNQFYARSAGNMNNAHNFDFMDPAVLAVGRGKSTNMLNNLGFEARSTSTQQPTIYEDEAKLWHLMQQSGSYHQDAKYSLMFSQENQSANQERGFSGHNGNGFSAMNDTYGYSSMLIDQHSRPTTLTHFLVHSCLSRNTEMGTFQMDIAQVWTRLKFREMRE
ncbi:RNA binding (RRM/RBD/RNP motifs) family protein [Actinidia rufa]|uniref:RNA binding (RRM/RBD/RNP motifs) family protein n=1 Tax=Actinidia rufa TaxID=165716 RepID=A0A7J0EDN4_9ERIC|nr:RNA binding (RRM/RBD/RNP motifs) family protein [Actinidia rufa]